ncbi:putative membrane protein [Mycobacteroides chelonae]|nr:putative membrane protein [Mycobacteroides chelonae]
MTPITSWADKLVSACVGILFGAFALYCAVQLIASIWVWLVAIVGTGGLVAVAVVVFRTTQNRW